MRCFLEVDFKFVLRLGSFFPGTGASSQGVLRFPPWKLLFGEAIRGQIM